MIDDIVKKTLSANLKVSGSSKEYVQRVQKLVEEIESGRFDSRADKIQNLVELLIEEEDATENS